MKTKTRQSNTSPLTEGMRATMPAFGTAIVFSFFINLLMFVSPLYMLQVYDRVITSRSTTTLITLTVIAGLLLLVYAILETLRSRILVRAGLLFDDRVAVPVFDAVHRGNLRQPSGSHGQALRDVDTMREFLTGSGLIALCDAPWVPIFVAASFSLHAWFGYIAIAGSVLILFLTLVNELATKKELKSAQSAMMAAGQSAQATLRNGEVLQAMGMLGALRGIWGGHHENVLKHQALASDRAGVIMAATKFVRMFLQTVILGTGAYLAIKGEISAGAMIAASILIGRALQPVELAVANWKGFLAARGALDRVKGLFAFAGPERNRMSLPRPKGELRVENLIAAAPGQQSAILKGLTFAIDPGETVAVVGPSAAGKSTLARILVGVWPNSAGAVRIDGSELSHWHGQELGQYIGYLPQDVELFAGTVAQNIARFQEIDNEAVIQAAQIAGCHELIQRLAEGYNTQIGEGGHALSGGQRQRVGLARAIYGKPSFIVLDEPNANLDAAGEEALLRAIQVLKQLGTTVVLITHKVNILSVVDKIMIMNNGTVQAFGRRDEILGRIMGPKVVQAPQQAQAVGGGQHGQAAQQSMAGGAPASALAAGE